MGEIKTQHPSILNSSDIEVREYQVKIAEECSNKNSLVVLPTGLGKTIIAVLVASKILENVPSDSKIIILAPTRPLINQHYETFLKFLNIPKEKFMILTGKILPEKRINLFKENQILFFTPQTLRNDLVKKKYTLKNTALIIFDEAHHTSGDYPYTMISDEYLDQNPDGILLALTASPGASKKKIATLCESLHIPIKNIHLRTRKDKDVKMYLKPMNIYKIGVDLTSFMAETYNVLNSILEERLQYLSRLNFLDVKEETLTKKVIRKDLLRLNSELVRIVNSSEDKTGVYSALSINAQALIIYHTLELVEQQGLDVLLLYLEKLNKDAKKRNSSKASRILAADGRLRNIYIELMKNRDLSPENLTHPKHYVLTKIISEELQNVPSARILVFVKLRNSVKNIVDKLKSVEIIKPVRFVGQATKSQDDKGLSQKRQIEILDQFKKGIYNVLVSTNVGEEGLDIAECDLVIFFDVVASEIRLIQRKGRTARHREGKVVILYCKGTHDEIYLRIALSKLKKMNVVLKNPQQLQESYLSLTELSSEIEIDSDQPEVTHEITKSRPIYKKIIRKQQHQSKLQEFFGRKNREEMDIQNSPIRISKFFPMKFGLRRRLQSEGVAYAIVDSDLHMILHNKVLIQIYNPKNIIFEEIVPQINDFKEICSLLIVVFDFIDFDEDIEGVKRVLKRKIKEFAKEHLIQAISINNEEELFFLIKNILQGIK